MEKLEEEGLIDTVEDDFEVKASGWAAEELDSNRLKAEEEMNLVKQM
jgi:hypothetical protein